MIGWRLTPHATGADTPAGAAETPREPEFRLGDIMRGERATLGKSLLDVQRELRIKATYIAAIENADVTAFETPGFIAGYVRSYARYLGMDPDETFRRFCLDADFAPKHGIAVSAESERRRHARRRMPENADEALANPSVAFVPKGQSVLSRIEPGAIGSIIVLAGLIGAICYGGWSVLREVQRVQLAPIDEAPTVVVQIDPLQRNGGADDAEVMAPAADDADARATAEASGPEAPEGERALADGGDAVAGDGARDLMSRLYRPEALDVPVFTPRNGPIAAIDPRAGATALPVVANSTEAIEDAIFEALAANEIQVTVDERPEVRVLAVRPAWVRISADDGTVLLEKILDPCETYAVPTLEEPARIRTGNSGGVYFVLGDKTFGPAAPGVNVAKNIVLSPDAIAERYVAADPAEDGDLARILTASADAGAPMDFAASCSGTSG